jgi:hypothetical protein
VLRRGEGWVWRRTGLCYYGCLGSVLNETNEVGGQSAGDGVVQGNDIVSY